MLKVTMTENRAKPKYCSILLRHHNQIKIIRIQPITRFGILSVFKSVYSGERIQKVADSHTAFAGLRIQNYPDTYRGTGPHELTRQCYVASKFKYIFVLCYSVFVLILYLIIVVVDI